MISFPVAAVSRWSNTSSTTTSPGLAKSKCSAYSITGKTLVSLCKNRAHECLLRKALGGTFQQREGKGGEDLRKGQVDPIVAR